MIYIFDVDNTLADRDSDQLYDHVAKWFAQHKPQRVALATNQGGVGLRAWMERDGFGDPEKLPTEQHVIHRLSHLGQQIATLTGGDILICYACAYQSKTSGEWSPQREGSQWLKSWRKPGTGMLNEAMQYYKAERHEYVFVGDNLHNNYDELAAKAAGITYTDHASLFADFLH